ncbi:MAG: hypothetical protein M9887_07530 [Chitinophagales bacterium]|nr:hypothetical protein [Chitinophagales bacterium]
MNTYEAVIEQLEQFIRKYYLSKMVKGLLLCLASVVAIYLLVSMGEYLFYFPSWLKWSLLLGFFSFSAYALVAWVLLPASKYFKIGQTLSYVQAAQIIRQHFPLMEDKLLNILQLKSEKYSGSSSELIEAGIQQKIDEIKWVSFSSAVDMKEVKKALQYAVVPMLVLALILLITPNVLKESNARLAQPSKAFSPPAPFDFVVENSQLKVQQFADALITVQVKGGVLPSKMIWVQDGKEFPMTQESANSFRYKIQQVQKDTDFRLLANGFYSDTYSIKVLKKAVVSDMKITLDYPDYTGKKRETVKNTGDILVPEGTKVSWDLNTKNTEKLTVKFQPNHPIQVLQKAHSYLFSKTVLAEQDYLLTVYNNDYPQGDSVLYTIGVIRDESPVIQVVQVPDSIQKNRLFFMGNASDDYGIAKIIFQARIKNSKNQIKKTFQENIAFADHVTADFTHFMDVNRVKLEAGDRMEYFFTVWDNDAIHGSKSAQSQVFTYIVPEVTELKDAEIQNNAEIKSSLNSSFSEVQKISKDIQDLKEKILTKKDLNWEDKKEIEKLKEEHDKLKNEIESLKNKYDENLKNQELFKNVDPEIMKKQEMLSEMMDKLLDDDMKNMMKEIEEMLEKLQKNNAFDKLENINLSNRQLEKELDKMLELFKKLEFEQKVTEMIQQLEDLSKKQDQISKEPNSKNQEMLNEKFDELKKDMEHLDKLNEEQKSKMDLEEHQKQMDEIQKKMQDAKDKLDKGQNQPAQSQQNQASESMKSLAQNIRGQMQKKQMQQHIEDINTIRRILSNLLHVSKDQEALMLDVKKTHETDVRYSELVRRQQKLKEESVIIEDSLTALGKRVFQLQPFITDELYKLKRDLNKSFDLLNDKSRGPATAAQQYAMSDANNLALMLNESMNQMQKQLSQMGAAGSCDNPQDEGQGTPSAEELKKLQQQLGQDLQQMGQDLKNGKSGSEINKRLAEMVQRQAAVREALRKMKDAMSQQQKKETNVDQMMDDMDKMEEDIVNKKITAETIKRQKEIETRMLELDKAMKEQGDKDDRTSKVGKEMPKNLPPEIEEFLKNRKSKLSTFKNIPAELKQFYKNIVDRYNSNN